MKLSHILVGAVISVAGVSVSLAESPRESFNQQQASGVDKRAIVEEIATEQGIDLSTREGRKAMAEYLTESGQQDLLPPRHHRKHGKKFGRNESDGQGQIGQGQDNGMRPPKRMKRPQQTEVVEPSV